MQNWMQFLHDQEPPMRDYKINDKAFVDDDNNWDEHKRVPHLQVCEKFY